MILVNIGIKTEIPKTENFKFLLFSLKLLICLKRECLHLVVPMFLWHFLRSVPTTSTFVCLYMNTPVSGDLGIM